jgi:hypothetical protein
MSVRLVCVLVTGVFSQAAIAEPSLGGVWLVENPQAEVKTTAGKTPPLEPEAAQLHAKRARAGIGKNPEDPVAQCLPHGVPRLLNAARPIHILQKPKQVTVLYEANHQARMFYIDDPLPAADAMPDITFNGTSYARWSGDTLVVDTIAMNDQTWLDDSGLPHGLGLKVTERYELLGQDRLRVTATITDPETYTAPWDMQVTYKRRSDLRFKEDPCAEKLWHPDG